MFADLLFRYGWKVRSEDSEAGKVYEPLRHRHTRVRFGHDRPDMFLVATLGGVRDGHVQRQQLLVLPAGHLRLIHHDLRAVRSQIASRPPQIRRRHCRRRYRRRGCRRSRLRRSRLRRDAACINAAHTPPGASSSNTIENHATAFVPRMPGVRMKAFPLGPSIGGPTRNGAMQKRPSNTHRNCIEQARRVSVLCNHHRVKDAHGGRRTTRKELDMKKLLFGAFLVSLVAATPARAQGDKPVHVNIGGGATVPVSDVSDRFGTGGGFNIGVIVEPTASRTVGFQFEYGYNSLAGNETTIPTSMHTGSRRDQQRAHRVASLDALPGLQRHRADVVQVDRQAVWDWWLWHVLPQRQPDDARHRLHDVVRSLLVRLLSRGRAGRSHHR